MEDKDLAQELANLKGEISRAHQALGQAEGEKSALGRQKNEIIEACKHLGVLPTLAGVEEALQKEQEKLQAILASTQLLMKK